MSLLQQQVRCLRTSAEIDVTDLVAICHRSDSSPVLLGEDESEIKKPMVLLYTSATADEQIFGVMDALRVLIPTPLGAFGGISLDMLRKWESEGICFLVDYVFSGCYIPDGHFELAIMSITRVPVV